MTLADHMRVIATNWWRILLVAAAFGALAYLYSNSQANVYESATLLSVAPGLGNENSQNVTSDELSFRAEYYAAIARTITVAGAGAKRANLNITPTEAASRVGTLTNQTSGFILLKGKGPTPVAAQALTQGTGDALKNYVTTEQQQVVDERVRLLQGRITVLTAQQRTVSPNSADYSLLAQQIAATRLAIADAQTTLPFSISTVTPAIFNNTPVSPTPARDSLLAFLIAGIIVAEALVIIRAFSDRFARSQDAAGISEFTGLPVLAMIPRGRGPDVVEAFRTLRTNLLFLEGAGRPRTVALVSPNPNSGKSFCAIHLAESAVAVDAEVVLVDCDLRRPVIHSRVRVPREPGLSDALRGADIHHCVHCVEGIPNLKVMPSGSPVSDT